MTCIQPREPIITQNMRSNHIYHSFILFVRLDKILIAFSSPANGLVMTAVMRCLPGHCDRHDLQHLLKVARNNLGETLSGWGLGTGRCGRGPRWRP